MPLLYYTQYTLHNTILRTIRKVQAPEKACRSETYFAKEEHSVAKTKKTYIYIYKKRHNNKIVLLLVRWKMKENELWPAYYGTLFVSVHITYTGTQYMISDVYQQ